jgi:hypothetical protein
MTIVTDKGAYKCSWIIMTKHPDLHVNNAVVIVDVNENRQKHGIGHDQLCINCTTKYRSTPSSAEQTP